MVPYYRHILQHSCALLCFFQFVAIGLVTAAAIPLFASPTTAAGRISGGLLRGICINQHPLPWNEMIEFGLCIRCTAIIVGLLSSPILPMRPSRKAVVLLLPLTFDGLFQVAGWHESSTTLRLVTGFLAGIAFHSYATLLDSLLFSTAHKEIKPTW